MSSRFCDLQFENAYMKEKWVLLVCFQKYIHKIFKMLLVQMSKWLNEKYILHIMVPLPCCIHHIPQLRDCAQRLSSTSSLFNNNCKNCASLSELTTVQKDTNLNWSIVEFLMCVWLSLHTQDLMLTYMKVWWDYSSSVGQSERSLGLTPPMSPPPN